MQMFRPLAAAVAIAALASATMSPASARTHRIVHKRHVVTRVAEPAQADYVAQAPAPVYTTRGDAATPLLVGGAVGLGTGLLVANSADVASALGASTTVGAGFGFGAIGGVTGLILYCAIARPHQECF
jgi:hypothetical protein